MLNDNINKYMKLKEEYDALKEQLDELKESILVDMEQLDTDNYTTDENIVAKVVTKENFKYIDEPSMIKWLKENGYSQFIAEKVSTVPMNKELRKGLTLTESLKPMFTKITTYSLNVERQ